MHTTAGASPVQGTQESHAPSASPRPRTIAIVLALLAVYFIWGSTYLAIMFSIETIPPLLMAGFRSLIAGLILFAWKVGRAPERPTPVHWRSACIVGGLLLLGGNGGVTWSEQFVPSGLTSLLIATVPLWVVAIDWARPGGSRPSGAVFAGLGLGLLGLLILIGPRELLSGERPHPVGTLVLLTACVSWSAGSIASRHLPQPRSALLAVSMQMICGGTLLLVAGTLFGEPARFDPARISARSMGSFVYLVTFGSIVAFSCYVWLLRVTAPSIAATYASVNPVVAVLLGAWLGAEPLTPRTFVSAAVIVASVAIITIRRNPFRRP